MVLYEQNGKLVEKTRSPKYRFFRRYYSTQNAILKLLRISKKDRKESCETGTMLVELSKANGCLPYKPLYANLAASGFDEVALKLIEDQRGKIGPSFRFTDNSSRFYIRNNLIQRFSK